MAGAGVPESFERFLKPRNPSPPLQQSQTRYHCSHQVCIMSAAPWMWLTSSNFSSNPFQNGDDIPCKIIRKNGATTSGNEEKIC